jgi:hypothetical protein
MANGGWRPRQGAKLIQERKAGRIELFFVAVLRYVPKIVLHPLWGIAVATLIVASGTRYGLFLRSCGLVFVALWLAADLWAWLLPKKMWWKFAVGWTGTSTLLILSMLGMKQFMIQILHDQRANVREHLDSSYVVPKSGDLAKTLFTFTNGGSTAIAANHQIYCGVNLLVFGESATASVIQDGGIINRQAIPFAINPQSDSQSEECFEHLLGLKVICADLTLGMEYALDTQPDIPQHRCFRWIGVQGDGVWYKQSINMPHSKCEDFVPNRFKQQLATLYIQGCPSE